MDKPRIVLETFEGPLDLLLYLIKENKMDVYDIQISVITAQYLEFLELMSTFDIEIASEFMVMASTLMLIKSRMLLPAETVDGEEIDIDDPREDLVRKLLEYRTFKRVAEIMAEHEERMALTYRRDVSKEVAAYSGRELLFDFSFFELLAAFKDIMDRAERFRPHEVIKEDYKIEDKIAALKQRFSERGTIRLVEIFRTCRNKLEMVVFVLAVLEMARMKEIKVIQNEVFGEVWLYRNSSL